MTTSDGSGRRTTREARVGEYRRGSRIRDTPAGTWFPAVSPDDSPAGLLLVHPGVDLRVLQPTLNRLAELALPGVLPLTTELTTQSGRKWITSTAPPGPALSDVIDEGPHRRPGNAALVLRDIAQTLISVHQAGLAHGRLATTSVVLTPSGHAVLTDWATNPGANQSDDVAGWTQLARLLAERWCAESPEGAAALARAVGAAASGGLGAGVGQLAELAEDGQRALLADAASIGPVPARRRGAARKKLATLAATSPAEEPSREPPEPAPVGESTNPQVREDAPPVAATGAALTGATAAPGAPAADDAAATAAPPRSGVPPDPTPSPPSTDGAAPAGIAASAGTAAPSPSMERAGPTAEPDAAAPPPGQPSRVEQPPAPAPPVSPFPPSAPAPPVPGGSPPPSTRTPHTEQSSRPTQPPPISEGRPNAHRPSWLADPVDHSHLTTVPLPPIEPSRKSGNQTPNRTVGKESSTLQMVLIGALSVVLALASALLYLRINRTDDSDNLQVQSVTLQASPHGGVCMLTATINTNGQPGLLTYRWSGELTGEPVLSVSMPDGEHHVTLGRSWSGSSTTSPDPRITIQILSPTPQSSETRPAAACP